MEDFMWEPEYKKFAHAEITNNYKNNKASYGSSGYSKDIDEDTDKEYSYFFVINENFVIEKHKIKYCEHWDIIFTIHDFSKYGSFSTDVEYTINSKYVFFTIEDAVAARYTHISQMIDNCNKKLEKYISAKNRAEKGEIIYNVGINDRGEAFFSMSPNSSGWMIGKEDTTIIDSAICLISKYFGNMIEKLTDELNTITKFKTLNLDYINGWKKGKEA